MPQKMKWTTHRNGVANIVKIDIGNVMDKDSMAIKASSSILGFGSGLIAQNTLAGRSKNSFKNLLVIAMQATVTGVVAKCANEIVSSSSELMKDGISLISQHA